MNEILNLKHKIGQGISPRAFMEGMEVRTMELSGIPNTKDQLNSIYENFAWVSDEDSDYFGTILEDLHCLILCTDWCPDVIWNVPVLFRVMEQAAIAVEVLIMEDHLETMDLFLTDGGRAQPIAVLMKTSGEVLGSWGARPAYIQAVMDRFKANNPDKEAPDYRENLNQTYREIGSLYRSGNEYQQVMLRELRDLFQEWL
ncbi:thioredoxin family protein [Paenibacillus sp. N1-5-1-14]|uniref:thioredoxin family protein n=1 Tax=Paenibacillus radicibacter TaxID=2972488 RepID=UPI0021594ADA|nr:thioredoxin family protein [Paenibacillus radicibacter]MCR8643800.1 thioredoxin family protein [Paenibacillus radicibacter]